jgi:hypothetical protein
MAYSRDSSEFLVQIESSLLLDHSLRNLREGFSSALGHHHFMAS